MASTKTDNVIWSGQSLTAGGGPTTSSAIDLTDGYGAELGIKITNGSTGPTTAAQIQIQSSLDNTEWYNVGTPLIGGVANSEVVSWGMISIDPATQFIRLVATHPTGQNVTVEADLSELSAL